MRNPFGPLAWWELRRLGRSRWLRRLRIGVVLTLLAVQFLFFLNYFAPNSWAAFLGRLPLGLDQMARFGTAYHDLFVGAETVVLFLMVPILFVEPVNAPRDRQMLDLLRTSPLSNLELVFGLILLRAMIVAGLIITSWPILALGTLYGGVGLGDLFDRQMVLLAMSLLWGAIAFHIGIVSDGRLWTYGLAYAINGFIGILSLCLGVRIDSLQGFAVTFSVGVIGLLIASTVAIRTAIIRYEGPYSWKSSRHPVDGTAAQFVESMIAPTLVPPLGDRNPWFWKERHIPERFGTFWIADLFVMMALWSTVFYIGMMMLAIIISSIARDNYAIDSVLGASMIGIYVFGIYYVGMASLRTSISVVREREQRTLESLLTIPEKPSTILFAKWYSSLHGYRVPFTILGIFLTLAMVLDLRQGPYMFGQALQLISWLILMNTLALWLSVRSRSTASAMILLIVCGIALLVGPPLLAPLFGKYDAIVLGMSFATGWERLFWFGNLGPNLAGALIASALSLLGSWGLWQNACRRL